MLPPVHDGSASTRSSSIYAAKNDRALIQRKCPPRGGTRLEPKPLSNLQTVAQGKTMSSSFQGNEGAGKLRAGYRHEALRWIKFAGGCR
jgi:hypothetical protein